MIETFEAVHLGFGCFSQKKSPKGCDVGFARMVGTDLGNGE